MSSNITEIQFGITAEASKDLSKLIDKISKIGNIDLKGLDKLDTDQLVKLFDKITDLSTEKVEGKVEETGKKTKKRIETTESEVKATIVKTTKKLEDTTNELRRQVNELISGITVRGVSGVSPEMTAKTYMEWINDPEFVAKEILRETKNKETWMANLGAKDEDEFMSTLRSRVRGISMIGLEKVKTDFPKASEIQSLMTTLRVQGITSRLWNQVMSKATPGRGEHQALIKIIRGIEGNVQSDRARISPSDESGNIGELSINSNKIGEVSFRKPIGNLLNIGESGGQEFKLSAEEWSKLAFPKEGEEGFLEELVNEFKTGDYKLSEGEKALYPKKFLKGIASEYDIDDNIDDIMNTVYPDIFGLQRGMGGVKELIKSLDISNVAKHSLLNLIDEGAEGISFETKVGNARKAILRSVGGGFSTKKVSLTRQDMDIQGEDELGLMDLYSTVGLSGSKKFYEKFNEDIQRLDGSIDRFDDNIELLKREIEQREKVSGQESKTREQYRNILNKLKEISGIRKSSFSNKSNTEGAKKE